MKPKLKPDLDLDSVQSDLIETVCNNYKNGVSVRALAKQFELSPMKARKILITGGCYSTDLSTEIGELYKDGKTVGEIAVLLSMTSANVNSYLPYERIIYNMEERSVEADRQQRYRDRKKKPVQEVVKREMPRIERRRSKTMVFVIGKKLRTLLPKGIYDETSDPLARDHSSTMLVNGEFVEPRDPNKRIWCAEATIAGRGKNKKIGVVLESANCGFAVMSAFPPTPGIRSETELDQMSYEERRATEKAEREKIKAYRQELETVFINAIREGMISFALPEDKVLDYTDTVARVELVKGRRSAPGLRLEELIEQELPWKSGDDPVQKFNVRGNWTDRKYGNSSTYRRVESALHAMLGMTEAECEAWLNEYLKPIRERMTE